MKNKHTFTYSKNNSQNKPKILPKKRFRDKVKENLNKILFWVIITSFCLFTLGSTLGTVAFFKTAKADSVDQTAIYEGNSLMFPTQAFTGNSAEVGTSTGRPFYLSFDYIISVSPLVIDDTVVNVITVRIKAVTNANYIYLDGYDHEGQHLNKEDNFIVYTLPYEMSAFFDYKMLLKYDNSEGYYANYAEILFRYENGFNGNVTSIRMYSWDFTSQLNKTDYYFVRNFITLYDNNGKYFEIEIPICTQSRFMDVKTLMYEDRTYYNSNNFSEDVNFKNGFQDGYDKGKIEGEEIGYNKGKAEGIEKGFADGKAYGIAHSNDYTLYALISSIFNVPITSFVHLINFEFFGVNLANFFTGILTMAVILFVVSKLFGK